MSSPVQNAFKHLQDSFVLVAARNSPIVSNLHSTGYANLVILLVIPASYLAVMYSHFRQFVCVVQMRCEFTQPRLRPWRVQFLNGDYVKKKGHHSMNALITVLAVTWFQPAIWLYWGLEWVRPCERETAIGLVSTTCPSNIHEALLVRPTDPRFSSTSCKICKGEPCTGLRLPTVNTWPEDGVLLR